MAASREAAGVCRLTTIEDEAGSDRDRFQDSTWNLAERASHIDAPIGREKEHDAPSPSRPAHFPRPRARPGGSGDGGLDFRCGDSADQRLAVCPFTAESFAGGLEVAAHERLFHVGGALRDAL